MKVLMFGWEFPPHITGGLGTACFGLTKGMSSVKDVEVVFVVPKLFGDETQNTKELLGADKVSVDFVKGHTREFYSESQMADTSLEYHEEELIAMNKLSDQMTYIEVASLLTPYLSPELFEEFVEKKGLDKNRVSFTKDGKLVYRENGVLKEIKLDRTELWNTDEKGFYSFSGKYGVNLYREVSNYASVAAVIARQKEFDVIHAHDWLTYAAGVAAKRASGKPLVIHVHATEFDRSGENVNQHVYDLERMGMHNADRIIAVSNLTRNTVIERYGVAPEKVVTVYNAVEPHTIQRPSFKKNIDDKIVTFLGRVTFQKGPDYFLEAAHKVLQRMDNVKFVMAGSGDMLRSMISRAAELRIGSHMHFTNFLKGEDVNHMFDISDVYVMPSVSEPFGISPLEAMRSNVPVVISKQSGVAEILKHTIKVDFWDVDAMADAIYGLINYDGLSAMFKRHGKQEVDDLKWDNAAQQVKNVYDDVLKYQ